MNAVVDKALGTAPLDRLFISGDWVAPETAATAAVVNPSDEQTIAHVAEPGPAEAVRAVAGARAAFDDGPWGRMSMAQRIPHVKRLIDALTARVPGFNDLWGLECGPTEPFRAAINSIVAPTLFADAITLAEQLPDVEARSGFAGDVELYREPFGVAVAILTYNGPLSYAAMKVVPALLAGNTVIVKLPPETRLVAQLMADAAAEADLPPGVLSVFAAGAETSRALVEHPDVDVVSFTGGSAVGAQILHSTADRIAKTTLELGGKSAGIVADDMPLEELIPALLPGLLPFQGQVCVALTRLLVPRGRHDEIVAALAGVFGSLRIGDAMDPATDFGPVAVARTRDRCEQFVAQAVQEGATVAAGGRRPAGLDRGWYYEPTLLTGVTNGMTVAREEVFGPVFSVLTYDDIDDAVAIANDSAYGLTGAIFTRDPDLARSVGRRLRVGTFTMNTSGGVLGQAFGGYKRSGLGREMGLEGFLEWFQVKVMKVNETGNYLS